MAHRLMATCLGAQKRIEKHQNKRVAWLRLVKDLNCVSHRFLYLHIFCIYLFVVFGHQATSSLGTSTSTYDAATDVHVSDREGKKGRREEGKKGRREEGKKGRRKEGKKGRREEGKKGRREEEIRKISSGFLLPTSEFSKAWHADAPSRPSPSRDASAGRELSGLASMLLRCAVSVSSKSAPLQGAFGAPPQVQLQCPELSVPKKAELLPGRQSSSPGRWVPWRCEVGSHSRMSKFSKERRALPNGLPPRAQLFSWGILFGTTHKRRDETGDCPLFQLHFWTNRVFHQAWPAMYTQRSDRCIIFFVCWYFLVARCNYYSRIALQSLPSV